MICSPLLLQKRDAQRKGTVTSGNGGKDSVKEDRQGCLSRFIRAGTGPLAEIICSPLLQYKKAANGGLFILEQATGIEPASAAWEAAILPMNYACMDVEYPYILP